MAEIITHEPELLIQQPAPRRQPRDLVLVACLAAAIAVAGAGTAVAVGQAVFRDEAGNVGIDASVLSPAYDGERHPIGEIEKLQSEGKSHYSVNNRELVGQGISLHFDAGAEINT